MRSSDASAPGCSEFTDSGPSALCRRAATAILAAAFGCVLACLVAPGCRRSMESQLQRQMAWVSGHPDAPRPVVKAVLGKKLQEGVGMTTDAVVASWGEPDEKLDLGGGDARWIYRKGQARNSGRVVMEYTLIFNRGYLTKVLQSERR